MSLKLAFQGTLKLGSRGPQCVAVKRAMARYGLATKSGYFGKLSDWATKSPVLGIFAVRKIKRFQKEHGISQSGWLGPVTFKALAPYFDDYSISLYMPKEKTLREKVVEAARYFVSIEPRVHYTESASRMTIVRKRLRPPVADGIDIWEDCSSFDTGLYWIAGAPDPNGRGYDGQGYTGTLYPRGRSVTAAGARPGDLVFYGWDSRINAPAHVALYIGNGRVISHGSEAGPLELGVDYRGDRHDIRSYLP